MTYPSYTEKELYLLFNEPWEISDRPYMLHAAYALSCLYEAVAIEDEDEETDRMGIFGLTVPEKILKRLVTDIAVSFNDAACNGKQVDIWERRYTVRKMNAYDHKILDRIFDFPLRDGEYTITRDGILNLRGEVPEMLKKYEDRLEEVHDSQSYLRKIILTAEDDENDGWDRLTDMEIAVYCWGMYYSRFQFDNLTDFMQRYRKYMYVTENDLHLCMIDKCQLRNHRPDGMYTFSARKIREWNADNGQESVIDSVPDDKAADYWYEVALKGTFRPIDMRKGD